MQLDTYDFGSADFTIECWYFPTVATLYNYLFSANYAIQVYHASGTLKPAFAISHTDYTSYDANKTSVDSAVLNSWNHIAFVRHGTTWTLYLNGKSVAEALGVNITLPAPTVVGSLGAFSTGSWFFNGFIDKFRVTKGVARYTQGFIPA